MSCTWSWPRPYKDFKGKSPYIWNRDDLVTKCPETFKFEGESVAQPDSCCPGVQNNCVNTYRG